MERWLKPTNETTKSKPARCVFEQSTKESSVDRFRVVNVVDKSNSFVFVSLVCSVQSHLRRSLSEVGEAWKQATMTKQKRDDFNYVGNTSSPATHFLFFCFVIVIELIIPSSIPTIRWHHLRMETLRDDLPSVFENRTLMSCASRKAFCLPLERPLFRHGSLAVAVVSFFSHRPFKQRLFPRSIYQPFIRFSVSNKL